MLKKVLYILLVIQTVLKVIAMVMAPLFGAPGLPAPVMVASGLVAAVGGYMIFKRTKGQLRMADLAVYFGLDGIQVAFNLAMVSIFSAMEVGFWEYMLLGTVLSILIDLICVILSIRRGRYVDIKNVMDAEKK